MCEAGIITIPKEEEEEEEEEEEAEEEEKEKKKRRIEWYGINRDTLHSASICMSHYKRLCCVGLKDALFPRFSPLPGT